MAVSDDVIDTLIAEAGGNIKGLHAVSAVIANRAAQLGITPEQVVKQSGQFEGYSNPGRASREAQKSPHIRALAEKAYNDIVSGAVPDPTNGGTQFRAASASGVLGKNVVNIGGNVFKLGNSPSSAVAAIDAVAPVPRSIPTSLSAYADTPAMALPPLPVPRPSNPEGIRSVEINPDGTLKQPAVFPSRSDTLMPFAGGLTAQPQGAGDSWGPESGRWGPANFANAFPMPAPRAPSEALTSRSVHTVQIDPFTGNPVGSNTPFVSTDHPLSNAVAPKTIYYNSTAGNVALPKGVVPASVTRDLASIAAQQMNRSGSPDDRQQIVPQIAPTPMPGRPAFNTPYIPGPSGFTSSNKDTSSLQPSAPLSFGSSVNDLPQVQAINQAASKPTTTYTYKQMQVSNPAYEKYISAQGADDIGAGPGSFANLQSSLVPPKTITKTVAVPHVPVPSPTLRPLTSFNTVNPMSQIVPNVQSGLRSTPIGHIGSFLMGEPVQGGLLSLLNGNNPLSGLGGLFGSGNGKTVVAPVGGNPAITYGAIVPAGQFAAGSPNASFEKQNGMGSVTNSMAASSRWNGGY